MCAADVVNERSYTLRSLEPRHKYFSLLRSESYRGSQDKQFFKKAATMAVDDPLIRPLIAVGDF